MISAIWGTLILLGIFFMFINGNYGLLNNELLSSSSQCLEMFLSVAPVMVLWMGLMKIAENSGLLKLISKKFSFLLCRLFPSLDSKSETIGLIASNIIINMVGLGSAATPFGLKAMQKLQEINSNKDEASDAMITFLVLNTSGVTLVPTTIISYRMMYGSSNPSEIISTALIATLSSSIAGLTLDYIIRRRNKK